ncbi:hypothetical protein ACDF64_07965 [Agromyces sp. MMS24-JH15]|uniref:hypothetical protein n=1 Tax=Agromyces sp. MMS24-JH15 TaxID=3243765 RepID=UPI00374A077B
MTTTSQSQSPPPSQWPINPTRTISIDGPAEEVLGALRTAFASRRFRVRHADGDRIELISGGILRGTLGGWLALDLLPTLRSWQYDIPVTATRVGPSTVRLDARWVVPRLTAFPFYDGIVEEALGALRAGGYAVEAGPYAESPR